MMARRLRRYQFSLRDGLILFLFISSILGITISRLTSYRALHEDIRSEMRKAYQLEANALIDDNVETEQIAHARRRIAALDTDADQHIRVTFILLGVVTASAALALSLPRLVRWFSGGSTSF